jgi:hypothetical protein
LSLCCGVTLFQSVTTCTDAANIEAKSVSLLDVSAAVNSAKDGDTVTVPAGTATWTTPLVIRSNIILQGAGAEQSVIIDEVPRQGRGNVPKMAKDYPPAQKRVPRDRERLGRAGKTRGNEDATKTGRNCLIFVSIEKDLPFRLTGFSFRGGEVNVEKVFHGVVRITGNSHSLRIDHCTFDQLHGLNLDLAGFLWGVIDHCRFNLTGVSPIHIGHDKWNGETHGNGSWADDSHWGSERFIFIEDNVFDNATSRAGIDAYEGARFVVRYNQFHNSGVTAHGTEGQGRGTRAIEEYNNVFRNDKPQSAAQIRSGCIITHDNKSFNVIKGHVLQAYRLFHNSPHWGLANGQNSYDDNASNPDKGYWETGKHTGPNGSTVLIDSTKHWAANQWYQPGAAFLVRNITDEAATAGKDVKLQSFAVSNTADTTTCSSLTFYRGKNLSFNTGDRYEIWKLVHSLDQPGLGRGELLRGLPGLPQKWPNQVTEPCYSWNNSSNAGAPLNLSSTEPSIKEGRDFFNVTAKPDYTPYTYPHPLVKGAPPPGTQPRTSAPAN